MIAKQSIIILSFCRSKRYASVVLGDFRVTFLREGEDAPFSIIFWLYTTSQNRRSKSSNSLVFHTSAGILLLLPALLFLIFLSTSLSSSRVNYPSLMFGCKLIVFVKRLLVTLGEFPSRFLKYSFHICIRSWLAAFSLPSSCSAFCSILLLSATLFGIVFLLSSFSF